MTEATEPQLPVKVRKGDPCTATPECRKPIVARGWCSMHYARWRKHGDPLHQMRHYASQGESCIVDDCGRPVHALNLCTKHYDRQKSHGETTDPRCRKFWAQVDKRGPDECWPWTGYVHPNGYGQFGAHTPGTKLPHRIAYEYVIGPIPEGLVLDHLCHTRDPQCADAASCPHRRCCNPEHLEPVTGRENLERGRFGDSWGFVAQPSPSKPEKPEKPEHCTECARTDKPVYKSGKCRPCYRKWLKDPAVERPSQRTPEQRFWLKVDKTESCWLWTASINQKTGYGQFARRHGEPVDAHRFSYELANGPIPERHDVHHTCHVRHCVNPAHLQALTVAQNRAIRKYRRTSAA